MGTTTWTPYFHPAPPQFPSQVPPGFDIDQANRQAEEYTRPCLTADSSSSGGCDAGGDHSEGGSFEYTETSPESADERHCSSNTSAEDVSPDDSRISLSDSIPSPLTSNIGICGDGFRKDYKEKNPNSNKDSVTYVVTNTW